MRKKDATKANAAYAQVKFGTFPLSLPLSLLLWVLSAWSAAAPCCEAACLTACNECAGQDLARQRPSGAGLSSDSIGCTP